MIDELPPRREALMLYIDMMFRATFIHGRPEVAAEMAVSCARYFWLEFVKSRPGGVLNVAVGMSQVIVGNAMAGSWIFVWRYWWGGVRCGFIAELDRQGLSWWAIQWFIVRRRIEIWWLRILERFL